MWRKVIFASYFLLSIALGACGIKDSLEWGYKPLKGQIALSLPRMVTVRPEKPEGLGPEPKYNFTPLYGSFSYGINGKETPYTFVLDKNEVSDKKYNCIYPDRDRDGNILEEEPVVLNKTSTFDLLVSSKGRLKKQEFVARLVAFGPLGGSQPGSIPVAIWNAGTWSGELPLNGEKVYITLWDNKTDGIYNEPLESSDGMMVSPGDGFLMGRVETKISDFCLVLFCPALLEAGGELFDVNISSDGSSISFSKFQGEYGFIESSCRGLTVTLITGEGKSLRNEFKDGKFKVPAGSLSVFSYSMTGTDKFGISWQMQAMFQGQSKFTVEKGKCETLKAGPPINLIPNPNVGGQAEAGTTVALRIDTEDSFGRNISIKPVTGDSSELPDAIMIIKQGSTVIDRGECKAG